MLGWGLALGVGWLCDGVGGRVAVVLTGLAPGPPAQAASSSASNAPIRASGLAEAGAVRSVGMMVLFTFSRTEVVDDGFQAFRDCVCHSPPMDMRKFLGFGSSSPSSSSEAEPAATPLPTTNPDTLTVRRIINALGEVEPEQRRFLAGFAYVLSRAAHADLEFTAEETALMERALVDIGKLPEEQAVLVVEIAKNQADLYSGTEDFLVTREFAARATDDQRRTVVETCFAVVATDRQITSTEYAELTEIADELGLTRAELNVIRNQYKESLTAIQQMRGIEGAQSS